MKVPNYVRELYAVQNAKYISTYGRTITHLLL